MTFLQLLGVLFVVIATVYLARKLYNHLRSSRSTPDTAPRRTIPVNDTLPLPPPITVPPFIKNRSHS